MTPEDDAFISYAHIDNIGLTEGHKGWVANLHRALDARVGPALGRQPKIWRDPKLAGNDVLSDTLADRLRNVRALVSIVSPGYLASDWCRRELEEFCQAAEAQDRGDAVDRARIFKVLKTRVPLEQLPPALQAVVGYEFFKVDPVTDRVRELDEIFGPEAERDFWVKLDDLAQDLCRLITAPRSKGSVFLAETTSDLREQRDAVKRDLQQQGYAVLPAGALPLSATDAADAIRSDLERCMMSIHMIGRTYGLVPEGGIASLPELQNDLAIERDRPTSEEQGRPRWQSRLVWIPRGLEVEDERQKDVIQRLREDERIQDNADLMESSLEELKTRIVQVLRPSSLQTDPVPPTPSIQVYLQYDSRDAEAIAPWFDFLFKSFEVIHPIFSGEEAELRQYHEDKLRNCDGVMILHGSGNQLWLDRKLSEVQKSPGYGRTKPLPVTAICLIPPQTPEKVRFRTHRAHVIPQWEGLSPDLLGPFVSALSAREGESQSDGARDIP